MVENKKKFVRSSELPICPFCDGKIFYENWITHRIFHIECVKCKAHWRSGIKNDDSRDVYLELLRSENSEISYEYLNKKLSINYWRDLLKDNINLKL